MVQEIFPTKILVEDFDKDDEWTNELKAIVRSIFANEEAKGRDFRDIVNNSLPLFTEENENNFPILKELKQMFINGFYKLASSFEEHETYAEEFGLTKEGISSKISKETGRLPFMRNGDFKEVHNHTGAMAFGIFYLEDIQNDSEGGELVLRDPSFNSNIGFVGSQKHKVETKRNRLVVAPAHIWHEVTQFNGVERTAIIINLNVF